MSTIVALLSGNHIIKDETFVLWFDDAGSALRMLHTKTGFTSIYCAELTTTSMITYKKEDLFAMLRRNVITEEGADIVDPPSTYTTPYILKAQSPNGKLVLSWCIGETSFQGKVKCEVPLLNGTFEVEITATFVRETSYDPLRRFMLGMCGPQKPCESSEQELQGCSKEEELARLRQELEETKEKLEKTQSSFNDASETLKRLQIVTHPKTDNHRLLASKINKEIKMEEKRKRDLAEHLRQQAMQKAMKEEKQRLIEERRRLEMKEAKEKEEERKKQRDENERKRREAAAANENHQAKKKRKKINIRNLRFV